MSKTPQKTLIFLTILSLGIFSGCDKLSELTGSAKSPGKAPAPAAQASPAPKTQKSTADSKAAPKSAEITPDTLVQIGDWSLTIQDFRERTKALKEVAPEFDENDLEQNKLVLEELIRQQLLVMDAERTGVAEDKDIMQAVQEFRKTLIVREMATRITEKVKATEEEARQYYDENKQDFVEPAEWSLSEIVVPTEDEAKELLVELYKGADFAETARAKSKAKSAWQKGSLGFISVFPFPKMESVAQALDKGGLSSVFKGPEGYYIIKLDDKKGGEQKTFDEVKEDIINGLTLLKQQQAIVSYLDELRAKTKIYTNEKLLQEK